MFLDKMLKMKKPEIGSLEKARVKLRYNKKLYNRPASVSYMNVTVTVKYPFTIHEGSYPVSIVRKSILQN